MQRRKPRGSELTALVEVYHRSDHCGRLALAEERGVTPGTLCNWMSQETRPQPPSYQRTKSATWEEHLEVFKAMDRLTAFHQKVPQEITVTVKTDLPIAVTSRCDWHLGEFGVDYEAFERDTELICSEPGLYAFEGGDKTSNIIQPSKIGSSHNQIPICNQRALAILTLEREAESILVVGTGNHDWWSTLLTGEDWEGEELRKLKLVYTKHGGIVHLRVGDMLYPWLRLHKGRFRSSFNLTHSCKQYQRLYFPEARIVTIEHDHVGAIEQYQYDGVECVAIRPGTYSVYSDFAQQNGFFGAHVCCPTVVLFPHEDRLVGFKSMWDAVVFLRAVRATA